MTVYSEDQILNAYENGLHSLFRCKNYEDYVEAMTKLKTLDKCIGFQTRLKIKPIVQAYVGSKEGLWAKPDDWILKKEGKIIDE